VAVVREGAYSRAHPDRAELVVEVATSSHAIDLRVKLTHVALPTITLVVAIQEP